MPQIGTNGNDPETSFNNIDPVIYALDGDDVIRYTGNEGAYIEGGRGSDTIYSGTQAATVYGGDGDDNIFGGSNPSFRSSLAGDRLYGGAGNDIIHSGGGNDRIFGDEGNDTIYGTDSSGYLNLGNSSTIDGGPGNDIIFAGTGFGTRVFGGDGDDIIYGMNARVLFGGNGSDTYEVTFKDQMIFETEAFGVDKFGRDNVFAYVDFTLPQHVENLIMTYGVQTYGYGNGGDNLIFGNASNNVLEGKGGYDTLTGGAGSDLFVVNANWGVDVMTDFSAGAGTQDAVIFSRSVFSDYQQVIANARQVGTDTWIGDGAGNTVVLQNVTLASLHPDDFGFI